MEIDRTIKYFVTHDDTDAAGAVICENTFNAEEACLTLDIQLRNTYFCDYKDINTTVNKLLTQFEERKIDNNDISYEIKIVDISVDEETANRITEMLNIYEDSLRILLLDHHKTTDHLTTLDWCIIDQTRSGCKLLYDECYKNKNYGYSKEFIKLFEKFINMIDAYDTWKWKKLDLIDQRDIINLKTWYNLCGIDYFIDYYINKIIDNKFNIFDENNYNLIENYKLKQDEKIKYKMNQFKLVDGIAYIISDDIEITSLLADAILDKYSDVKIVAVIYGTGVALRSRELENYDVSILAKKYGGGGHKNAAGFKFNLLEILSEKIRLEI